MNNRPKVTLQNLEEINGRKNPCSLGFGDKSLYIAGKTELMTRFYRRREQKVNID